MSEFTDCIVIDASGHILGRLASFVAKKLLEGYRIFVVNAEKAVVSCTSEKSVVEEWKTFLEVGRYRAGPIHHRRPDRILRRVVRGMLPYRTDRGRRAYKRLKVYIGFPGELKGYRVSEIPEAKADKLRCRFITLAELAESIGWIGGKVD
ncbi:MAG: 50S ribosomal protein L13 [Nitrososphaerota archaeon]|nr:50S ribosomal protein L13 [Candidatus Bathyarchaeota archaeon]MCX8162746.1 50S ribosomal protein L13 [Candidatus Bathyarchaeota archaeon]MDW8061623.1 50S ribosomal protein L13 [Nitrososphaerota archaeon]